MNTVIQQILAFVIKKLISANLWEYLLSAVKVQFNRKLSGAEKKAAVIEQVKAAEGKLGEIVKATSDTYLNLAVEAAVAIAKAKLGL